MAEDGETEMPTRFSPSWPPRRSQRPMPNVFTKCSENFKKVTWPPKKDEVAEVAPPVATIQLKEEMPLNDTAMRPTGTYKAAPTIYAEDPDAMPDVWPPPEPINTDERVIHDPTRPKRVVRDYEVHFNKNKSADVESSYRVPPGTLHVVSQRGILSYDNVDIGAARMADEKRQ